MLRRWTLRLGVLLFAIAGLAIAWDVLTYDEAAWQADYTRLKGDMAQGYANLDWIAEHRRLDLRALDHETTAAIAGAHSRVRAFLAIRRFVHAFRDPHFRLEVGERPIVEANAVVASEAIDGTQEQDDPPAGADCTAAGYGEEGDHGFRFPFDRVPGWRPLRQGDFPTGMIGDTGVLRIAQFGEDRYAAACRKAFVPGIGDYALRLKVRALLQQELTDALREMRAHGAKRVLVDLTGNGGGTEWVTEVVALFTDRSLTREEPRLVAPRCDRRNVWRGPAPCPALEPPGPRAQLQGTGEWQGPVLILVDQRTASASEDFVAWLQQNRVAQVLGERTIGAGCGYVDGGTRTQFRASPFDVKMPNCARFLDDGRNEIEGLAPDFELPMQAKDAEAKAAALAAALAKA